MSRKNSKCVCRVMALLALGYVMSAAGCWAVAAGAGAGVGYVVGHEAGEHHDHDEHDHDHDE